MTGRTRLQALSPAIGVIFFVYKRCVSPVLHAVAPSSCKYLPTCSEYTYAALVRFGPLRGSWLALRRLIRCHPWAKGGLDPVPDPSSGLPNQHAPESSIH